MPDPNVPLPSPLPSARTRLILASTSPYRRELLARLRLPFEVVAPQVDETPRPGETPAALCERLALAKARAVARLHPQALVIGSDQVAACDGEPVGKPHTHERAVAQLLRFSGRAITFHTGLALVRAVDGHEQVVRVPVEVTFRMLDRTEIETYLRLEQPYDCAGSAKCETLGIGLLDAIRSDDPTALVGLPLIATCRLLRAAGLNPVLTAGALHG
ncbi:Maf family nucleotide pyrophosphatase [Leptothrix discophora]|uniref:7-methyl-GTP pyrophosphatase n=1 Tax=Leptothrix discophora TaxID=89 RepID=A0ABT9G095_LEPDI|nr:Maf family nucleotide pyrophosphatase [Leptothrix discophora]MDP4299831.1 Maf family nucleotide pyrophosphatase [Leptothrix discophora]